MVEDDLTERLLTAVFGEPAADGSRYSEVRLRCNRCGTWVDGSVLFGGPAARLSTSGFYLVYGDGPWDFATRTGERVLCDACMWVDPEYITRYGEHG